MSRKVLLGALLGVSGFALAGCDVEAPGGLLGEILAFGWPKGITPEATAMYNFWSWVWVAAWIIGFIMWGLFIYGMLAWNAKRAKKAGKDEFPRQTQYNVPLELVLTIVPIIIVMALFFFTVQTEDKVNALNKNPEVTVDVTGYQWNWKFGYQHVAAELSPTGSDYDGVDQERQAQAEASKVDPNGDNPINGRSKNDTSYLRFNLIETLGTSEEVPVLVLPSQTPIQFDLASNDVSHAFWVPEFLFKRDVYSHPEENKQERRFQIEKIEKEGAFVGRCAEMCGTYHSMMNFEIRVVSPEKFKEYLKIRHDDPSLPNSEALAKIGEQPYAVTTHPFNVDRMTRDGDNAVDNNELAKR
nr:cytochrome c oxidase subunit II [Corynebacterium sp. sy017]